MKMIRYKLCTTVNRGTEEAPIWEDILTDMAICCTSDKFEANLAIAKGEAYNGEYTIEDDGRPEPEPVKTDAERIKELEEALALLLSGAVE